MFVSAVYMNKWNTEPEAQHYGFQTEDMEPKLSRYPPPSTSTQKHYTPLFQANTKPPAHSVLEPVQFTQAQFPADNKKRYENHKMTLWEMLTKGHQCDLWVCATLRFVYKCTISIGLHYIFVVSPCFFLSKYISSKVMLATFIVNVWNHTIVKARLLSTLWLHHLFRWYNQYDPFKEDIMWYWTVRSITDTLLHHETKRREDLLLSYRDWALCVILRTQQELKHIYREPV